MSNSENLAAFEANKGREKICLVWLNSKQEHVKNKTRLVAFLGIVIGLLIIAQSALLAILIEKIVIESYQWQQLSIYYGSLLLVLLARCIFEYLSKVFGFEIAAIVKNSVRELLLDKFSALGPSFLKQQKIGALSAATLEHTEALESYFSRYVPQKIIVTVLPIIMIAVVMPINWVVACIFLITGPIIPVFMALIGVGAASAQSNQFLAMNRMSGYFLDRLQGITTLKLFGQADAEVNRIRRVADGFREKTMAVLRIAFLSSAVLEFFSAVAVALVAVYVGLGLLGLIGFGPAVDITLSEALFVLLLAPEFFNPLKQLATYYHDKAAAIGAADHILQILEQPEIIISDLGTLQNRGQIPSIEFKTVCKSFPQKEVFKSFDLQFQAGEKIALISSSGTGKTTLLNLLLGFEQANSGDVLIFGKPISQAVATEKIAWVGQKPMIFYATIADNISLKNPDISEQQIILAAMAAGVMEFSDQLNRGLQTWVGEKGYGLSGGQAHRIALARAFIKDAPIVLLDEPTAHLDGINKAKLLDAIALYFKQKTVIIASHDPQVIQSMDRVVDLDAY